MRFLADMGVAQSTAAFLRGQGHDAIHLRDEGLQPADQLDQGALVSVNEHGIRVRALPITE